MHSICITPPTVEPVSLAELKLHLKFSDGGTFADNVDETQLLPPGSHAHTATAVYTLLYELLTLDVAPGGAGWAAGDTLTGVTSTKTCLVVEKLTNTTYTIKNRSGAFILGEVITNGTATADQGATFPTFTSTKVEVLGYTAVVVLDAGLFTNGTVDVKIQDSDDGVTWTDWTGGAFTQVTSANDNAVQEIAYTGAKRYIRTAAKVLVAACSFSTKVIRLVAASAEDDQLNLNISEAREQVEHDTRRSLLTQTWDCYLDGFPYEKNYVELPFGNLQSVTHIKYKKCNWASSADDVTLVEGTDYLVETNGDGHGRIVLPYEGTWPDDVLYPSNPIVIRIICGWTTAALIPKKIKAAIRLLCAKLYRSRGDDVTGQTVIEDKTYDRLLSPWRLWGEF